MCVSCYAAAECEADAPADRKGEDQPALVTDGVSGQFETEKFSLALTLYSGQTFRWGRDRDGWWKGVAYGAAFRVAQDGDTIRYLSSHAIVPTYAGRMTVEAFLRWYLRVDEDPKVRVPRADRHLRKARDRMRGYRFVRQEPWECVISYILSVQAHMALTKQRLNFLAGILGREIRLGNESYHTFPTVDRLALLDEAYYRHQRFGWRSRFLPVTVDNVKRAIDTSFGGTPDRVRLDDWRRIVDGLREVPNSGIGLKVAKCIDLFSLERLHAVPVDTWVRKLAADWYGVEGSDAAICGWAEERGGRLAGYWNEYLFAYYRELNAPGLDDRVLSFAESDAPSAVLPCEPVGSGAPDYREEER